MARPGRSFSEVPMADVVYRVVTKYEAETEAAKSSVGGLVITFDHLINLMERAKGMIGHVLELSSAAEGAHLAIAGLLNATNMPGATTFQDAMKESSEVIKQLRRDAAALPGTFDDLQEVFQMAIPGGAMAGKSVAEIEHMSGQMIGVAKLFKINSQFAAREFAELMEGRARINEPLFARMRQFMGADMTAGKFNSLSAGQRWAAIEKGTSGFKEALDAYANTWDAISSTTESYAEQLIRIGSGGMFNALKHDLAELNAWYEKNQVAVDAWANTVGVKLADAMKTAATAIKDSVQFVVANKEVLEGVAGIALALKGHQMAGGGLSALGGASAGGASLLQRGARIAGGGGFGLALGAMVNDTGTTFGKLNTAAMGLAGALSSLPGPIGAVATVFEAVDGTLTYFINKFQNENDERNKNDTSLMALYKTFEYNGKVLDDYVFNKAKSLADQNHLLGPKGELDRTSLAKLLENTNLDWPGRIAARELMEKVSSRAEYLFRHPIATKNPTNQPPLAHPAMAHGLFPAGGNMTVHIHVEQTINDADDPDRVYISTKDALLAALNRKTSTPHGGAMR